MAWGQSVSIVVTHEEICVQKLGDNSGRGNLDNDNVYICTGAQNIADFPMIWQPAMTLLPSDTADLALWNQILPGISNIALKGQLTVMEARSMRHTMLWVILTAVSCILSSALLFGGGENMATRGHSDGGGVERDSAESSVYNGAGQR